MLISSAYAQAPGAAPGGLDSQIMSFAPLVLIFVVFYFLLIRPQQKRMKQHKEMLGAIRRGDRVVTNGGIIGTVNKVVNNDEIILEIADGIKVRALRSGIASIVAKTEPADADEDEAAGTTKS
jgi:preprotein translocase subunit YajC